MRIEQLMTLDVKPCRTQDMLTRPAQITWEHDVGCVPVLDAPSLPRDAGEADQRAPAAGRRCNMPLVAVTFRGVPPSEEIVTYVQRRFRGLRDLVDHRQLEVVVAPRAVMLHLWHGRGAGFLAAYDDDSDPLLAVRNGFDKLMTQVA